MLRCKHIFTVIKSNFKQWGTNNGIEKSGLMYSVDCGLTNNFYGWNALFFGDTLHLQELSWFNLTYQLCCWYVDYLQYLRTCTGLIRV